jgi:Ca2+-binding RTX toxin-like protein
MDLDGSGAIESGNEVLSETFNGFGFGSSMEALRSLDTNVDGMVDNLDAQFGDLRIWRDGNSDGVSQADELLSLDDLGVVSISVQEEIRDEVIDGQQVYAGGTFTYSSGATGDYVGAHLSVPEIATIDNSNNESGSGTPTAIEVVIGGTGADTLSGDDLANRLEGGGGNDTLTGGAGSDIFVLNSPS